MAILVSDIIDTVRGLISEDNEKYFRDTFLILAVNAATDHLINQLQTLSEFLWLTKNTITVTSQNVTDGKTQYDLATGIFYVSNFVWQPGIAGKDWRPNFTNSADGAVTYLEIPEDYFISLPYFTLSSAPSAAGTITYWGKASPTRVKKPDDSITIVHDSAITFYIEYVKWYCERREENVNADTYPLLAAEVEKVRRLMRNAQGVPRGFIANWEDVADFDG